MGSSPGKPPLTDTVQTRRVIRFAALNGTASAQNAVVNIIVRPDYLSLSQEAARFAADAVRKNPGIVLGLPTGSTPLGMYAELVREHRQGLDLSRVRTFNMDEYIGLADNDPQSYHTYMFREFFAHVNVPAEYIHIPSGNPQAGLDAACEDYEQAIRSAGGIDLQISGIGVNGHIGFNEPGSDFASRTRAVDLAPSTLSGMRRYFPNPDRMPSRAVTIGVGTILEARRVLLLASGVRKADAVVRAVEGPVSAAIPASALQLHSDVTWILDEDAASKLGRRPPQPPSAKSSSSSEGGGASSLWLR
jgi:glucosamine-6-phosphate deaminase